MGCRYYIKYTKNKNDKVVIVKKRPDPRRQQKFVFTEGAFTTKKQVVRRLNQMNIPKERRTEWY